VASDRPGLLCRVGRAFTECGIQLQNAKIATIGARVEDIFYITDANGNPLHDPQRFVELREALVRHLEDNGNDR
jgi:[protein-PII] uridylyltransferase